MAGSSPPSACGRAVLLGVGDAFTAAMRGRRQAPTRPTRVVAPGPGASGPGSHSGRPVQQVLRPTSSPGSTGKPLPVRTGKTYIQLDLYIARAAMATSIFGIGKRFGAVAGRRRRKRGARSVHVVPRELNADHGGGRHLAAVR